MSTTTRTAAQTRAVLTATLALILLCVIIGGARLLSAVAFASFLVLAARLLWLAIGVRLGTGDAPARYAAVAIAEEPEHAAFPWLNALLLGLTLVTTTVAGARYAGVSVYREPARAIAGLPYALSLMAILGVHELGHYAAARRHGIRVTLPYFIPVPFALGTFGAVIRMKSTPRDRNALFDVAISGPIAGLLIAVPALVIGLRSSSILPASADGGAGSFAHQTSVTLGSSALVAVLAKCAVGPTAQPGQVVQLSPTAFAGWLGLVVTALNLMPVGQLDGGHAAQGMFGTPRAARVGRAVLWLLFVLALSVRPEWLGWAILLFFLASPPPPPADDVMPISPARRALGYVMFAVLLSIITPVPAAFWP